jgi:hypothetical protein
MRPRSGFRFRAPRCAWVALFTGVDATASAFRMLGGSDADGEGATVRAASEASE